MIDNTVYRSFNHLLNHTKGKQRRETIDILAIEVLDDVTKTSTTY
jgi:hypothetical protein